MPLLTILNKRLASWRVFSKSVNWRVPSTLLPLVVVPVFSPASSAAFGIVPLDYANACTQQFVEDVCKYWLTRCRLDGFRFDQVTGFDNSKFPTKGAPQWIGTLKTYASSEGLENISRFSRVHSFQGLSKNACRAPS